MRYNKMCSVKHNEILHLFLEEGSRSIRLPFLEYNYCLSSKNLPSKDRDCFSFSMECFASSFAPAVEQIDSTKHKHSKGVLFHEL